MPISAPKSRRLAWVTGRAPRWVAGWGFVPTASAHTAGGRELGWPLDALDADGCGVPGADGRGHGRWRCTPYRYLWAYNPAP